MFGVPGIEVCNKEYSVVSNVVGEDGWRLAPIGVDELSCYTMISRSKVRMLH